MDAFLLNHLFFFGYRGAIGPKIQFAKGGMQAIQVYGLVAGAVAPLVIWFCRRKLRMKNLHRVSLLFLVGSTTIPPATVINYSSWFLVTFIFRQCFCCRHASSLLRVLTLGKIIEFLIRTRYHRWWFRYNYILGAALQTGACQMLALVPHINACLAK